MPKIPTYVAQTKPGGPVDVPRANPDTRGAQFGRGLEQLGNSISQVGDIVQKENEQAEISDVNVKLAEAKAKFTKDWSEKYKGADPADKTLADRFNSDLHDHLQSVGEGITTRAAQLHFEQRSANTKAEFSIKTYEDQAALAGMKARIDVEKAHDARAAMLLNDPSSYQSALSDSQVDLESNGHLSPIQKEQLMLKMKPSLAKAALRGWARLDPDYTEKQLKEGKWDTEIDGEVKHQIYSEIKAERSAKITEAARVRAETERVRKDNEEKSANSIYTDLIRGKTAGIENRILDDPYFDFATKRTMIDVVHKHQTEKIRTDPQVYLSLLKRIQADDGDSTKLNDEKELLPYAQAGRLTLTDLNALRGEMQGRRSEEGKFLIAAEDKFFQAIKKNITTSNDIIGERDTDGDANYYKFWHEAKTLMAEHKKSGKPVADLYNPKSENYLGHVAQKYFKSSIQIINEKSQRVINQAATASPTPKPVPKWKEGEDLTEFLKKAKESQQ